MLKPQQIEYCLSQLFRIASSLVPEKQWNTLYIEGNIVGSTTMVKAWYSLLANGERIAYNVLDIEYINEDNDNNMAGNFIKQLREVTYDAAIGAWYTVAIDFYNNNNQPVVRYNYYDQPKFRFHMPIDLYKKDLKIYSRPKQLIPDWLR